MPTLLETTSKDAARTYLWCRQQDAVRLTGVEQGVMEYWHRKFGMPPGKVRGQKRVYRKVDLVRMMIAREITEEDCLSGGNHGAFACWVAMKVLPAGVRVGEAGAVVGSIGCHGAVKFTVDVGKVLGVIVNRAQAMEQGGEKLSPGIAGLTVEDWGRLE